MKGLKTTAGSISAIAAILCICTNSIAAGAPAADETRGIKPPPTRSIDHPTGTTDSEPRGATSGDMTAIPTPEKEQKRGNTPPGTDRGGQGPASGAIVDPSGSATGRKPF